MKNIRILLIDDDAVDRETVSRHIRKKRLPYVLQTAAARSEAVKLLQEDTFDLILLDHNVGRGTGLDILPHAGDVPVIFLTDSGDEEIAVKAMRQGACDYLVKDPERNYMKVLPFTIQNVFERIQAEKALRESEEKFRLLSEQSVLGILIIQDDYFKFANQAAADIFEYSIAEMLKLKKGECYSKIIHPDDEAFIKKQARMKQRGKEEIVENLSWQALTKSGGTKLVESYGRSVIFGGKPAELVTIIDVSERRKAEERMQEQQRTLTTLMGNLPGMAYRRRNDQGWTMDFVSEGSAGLAGYVPSALIGNRIISYNDLIHSEDREPALEQVQAALEIMRPYVLEYRIRTAAGEEKWVWEKGVGIFTPEGELQALEGFIIDITERKCAEEELKKHRDHLEEMVARRTAQIEKTNEELQQEIAERKQAEEKMQFEMQQRKQAEDQLKVLVDDLERANRDLKDFAYVVSHDLKAPLRGINSLANWIVEDYGERLGQEGREYLDKLLSRTKRMQNFIDGILQYSRVGRIKTEPQIFDSEAVMREIIEGLAISGNISVRIEDKLPTVVYDKILFNRVFRNLVGNAVKHLGKPEGEVTISCRQQDDGETWEFCVRDNGVGIEARHFERIFKMFQGLKPQSEEESTGIGLALVKKIAERTGGKVWVESIVGEGSAFFFTIPGQPEMVESAPNLTVLIVDDNVEFINVARAMLELEGHNVLLAANRQEAEGILDNYEKEIQLILMDIHIPGEDPLDRYFALRKRRSDLKIIACTGVDFPQTLKELEEGGLDGILTKPFKISELYSIIGDTAKPVKQDGGKKS
ncbi:MAG: response regulator [Candidatus Aminicenantes bacterium]|nr:response regulator [Candidatus Aminicenantes bacterium]